MSFKSLIARRGGRVLMLVVAVAVTNWLIEAQASTDEYPFDLKTRHPKALAAYKKIVPAKYRKMAWIASLDGTAGPMNPVKDAGKKCLAGSVCWPHNCGGNQVAFLVAEDGSVAVALLRSTDLTGGKDVWFGKPTQAQIGILNDQLDD